MASLTIRDLDDEVKAALRVQAARNGRSMEAEARAILAAGVGGVQEQAGLGTRIHARFAALGGVDLELPERTELVRPVIFEP